MEVSTSIMMNQSGRNANIHNLPSELKIKIILYLKKDIVINPLSGYSDFLQLLDAAFRSQINEHEKTFNRIVK